MPPLAPVLLVLLAGGGAVQVKDIEVEQLVLLLRPDLDPVDLDALQPQVLVELLRRSTAAQVNASQALAHIAALNSAIAIITYVFNGIYIIDLQQSLSYIDRAYEYVKETVAHGGSIMFVGTKKQGQEAIAEQANRVGMPYVNERWLGGMLTNFRTIRTSLDRVKEIESKLEVGHVERLTKKEVTRLERELAKLIRNLGGVREMPKLPGAIFVVDTLKEHLAVAEAKLYPATAAAVATTAVNE